MQIDAHAAKLALMCVVLQQLAVPTVLCPKGHPYNTSQKSEKTPGNQEIFICSTFSANWHTLCSCCMYILNRGVARLGVAAIFSG